MTWVVFDCNVLMSAAGWHNEPYQCLTLVARRRLRAFATEWIWEEYRRVAARMEAERIFPHSPWPMLDWFSSVCRILAPITLGKQRSRDARDDPYLACALAARAQFIVSRDDDLLVLGKPFGVEIITPRALLSRIHQRP